ncbi:GIY-YIG nuclease family protein [Megasphaera sp.]|uniref:GIY-YIG nuclease family protein n=1 Tax=Megasphaera sp. TaxID=2023260 RepID=UPI00258AD98F|nr:GIY-YIG nuclease family protein [Megasphaera sp.]
MSNGYVYALVNPSMPGIVKIGMTTRNPEERVAELSDATGVPTPFILAYYTDFSDCETAERQIHAVLQEKGYRISDNREFFRLSSKEAIDCILSLKNSQSISEYVLRKSSKKNKNQNVSLAKSLIKEGDEYLFGTTDVIKDQSMALKCYKKAVKIGNMGYYQLAHMYLYGHQTRARYAKGIELYKEGIRNNEWICGAGLWQVKSDSEEGWQGLNLFFKHIDSEPDVVASYYLGIMVLELTKWYERDQLSDEGYDKKFLFYEKIIEQYRGSFIKQKNNILKYYEIAYHPGYITDMGIGECPKGYLVGVNYKSGTLAHGPMVDPIILLTDGYVDKLRYVKPHYDAETLWTCFSNFKNEAIEILEEICENKKAIGDIFLELRNQRKIENVKPKEKPYTIECTDHVDEEMKKSMVEVVEMYNSNGSLPMGHIGLDFRKDPFSLWGGLDRFDRPKLYALEVSKDNARFRGILSKNEYYLLVPSIEWQSNRFNISHSGFRLFFSVESADSFKREDEVFILKKPALIEKRDDLYYLVEYGRIKIEG